MRGDLLRFCFERFFVRHLSSYSRVSLKLVRSSGGRTDGQTVDWLLRLWVADVADAVLRAEICGCCCSPFIELGLDRL